MNLNVEANEYSEEYDAFQAIIVRVSRSLITTLSLPHPRPPPQKTANSEIQKPADVLVYHCLQSSQRTSQETEGYLNRFKRPWFLICDWWISICFVCFLFQGSLLVIVIMINQSINLLYLFSLLLKNKSQRCEY